MKIVRVALDEIVSHARDIAPLECCGVLLGVGDRVTSALRGRNIDPSPNRFLLDPADHIAARRQARATHQEVVGFYHSHPRSAAVPSPSDVAEASYPDAVSVIVGVRAPGFEASLETPRETAFEARAFTIARGVVAEQRLDVEEG